MAKKAEAARLMALDLVVQLAAEFKASMAAMKMDFPQETNLVAGLMQVLS
jgi:hypothetical protein